jgi:hypothetical protein
LARNSPSKKHLENYPAKNPKLVPEASQNGAIFDARAWLKPMLKTRAEKVMKSML